MHYQVVLAVILSFAVVFVCASEDANSEQKRKLALGWSMTTDTLGMLSYSPLGFDEFYNNYYGLEDSDDRTKRGN